MSFGGKLKAFIQRCVNVFGYRIEKLKDAVKAPIDVLDLLLTKLSAERPDFFFVQIGANNGLTDDPIRQFVTKYHWHGVLVEPQPQVFQQLLKNYEVEKQLAFENAAIADKDGTVRLFVADHRDETADLTVFASLKKDALIRGLDNPKAAGVQVQVHEVEVPALSVQTLLAKHRITKIDLLLTDVQGYDGDVRSFVHPCQSQSGHIGKQRRQPVRECGIVYLDSEDNRFRHAFAGQFSGRSPTVRWASAGSPPRRRASLRVVPTTSGPRFRKSIRTP